MQFVQKHIDAIAGAAALLWGVLVTLVPSFAPLAEFLSPQAAFTFALVAMGRWYAGAKQPRELPPST